MDRTELTFDSGGERCAAWLYEASPSAGGQAPAAADGRSPCVVLAHGFGAVRAARLWAFAERFAQAGLTALVFDYRHFGDSAGEPRQLLDIKRQLEDWRAAIAFARSLDGVDPDRVAAWGTSFSGGHAATMAAEDHRLAAAVSQAPMLDGISALLAAGPPDMARLTVAGVRDELRRIRGREPYRIPIVAPPGSLGSMTSPDAESGYRAMYENPDVEFRNEVAARVLLRIGLYRPIRRASRIACPWLVTVCERDAVTPPKPSVRAAKRAPRSELRSYDGGHFEIYVGGLFERAVADQIAFLRRHLLADAAADAPSGVRTAAAG
jgi:dienelactone hydrolase